MAGVVGDWPRPVAFTTQLNCGEAKTRTQGDRFKASIHQSRRAGYLGEGIDVAPGTEE